MLASLYFSFTEYNIVDPPRWVGLENYARVFSGIPEFFKTGDPRQLGDPLFWKSLQVTLYFASIALPLNLLFSFFLAVLLNQKVPGVNIWRTIFFLPSIISGVAVTLFWIRILNPRMGILNPFLQNVLGIDNPPGWLQDPEWAVPALVLMGLWGVGGSMIIYLAGLQGIPTDLYDAAKVDGANAWQRFWNVTFPMMTPVLFLQSRTGHDRHLPVFHRSLCSHQRHRRSAARHAVLQSVSLPKRLPLFRHGLRLHHGMDPVHHRARAHGADLPLVRCVGVLRRTTAR